MKDLKLNKYYSKNSKGNKVRLIQERLCLHGFRVAIDDSFGSATDRASGEFQMGKSYLLVSDSLGEQAI